MIVKSELLKILAWLTAAAGALLWGLTGHCQAHGCAWVISLVITIALYFVFSFLLDQYAKTKSEEDA